MAIDRRSFLVGAVLSIPAASTLAHAAASAAGSSGEGATFISACKRGDGSYGVLLLDKAGQVLRDIPLEARGHDIAIHQPTRRAAVFARRPGTFAVAFDLDGRQQPKLFTAPADRHYYGHGVFSPDGRLLYASENDIPNGAGVLGVYDVRDGFRRVDEIPTYGVGPHEVILMRDGKTFAVANGGIDTAGGRAKLNLDSMQPSLVFVDRTSGKLLREHRLGSELSQLSIRHIAEDATGAVWFGAQWEGDTLDVPELVGYAALDRPITLMQPDAPLGLSLRGYIGSVAMSRDGRVLAASAPRAGRILYVDTASARMCGETILRDGCGIAGYEHDVFAVSSGLGALELDRANGERIKGQHIADVAFDNHLRLLI
jgi:hypothetical protein